MVGSSPWLFAATHVLHRCQTPRHPPLALCSLEEQRCSCSLCSSQGAGPVTRARDMRTPAQPWGRAGGASSRAAEAAPSKQKTGQYVSLRLDRREETPTTDGVTWTRPSEAPTGSRPCDVQKHRLLRKEVIQPHLPVRLPCYDFTPIADPTFDGSLHKGWATGFGCYRLSWCDGRCVQGPGTYSPRRC